ncbi:MAG: alkene reductase [Pseudomonadota bacterium]
MTEPSRSLFEPARAGALHLDNSIVMAPLTRSRAIAGEVPNPLAVAYYRQRASAGLIVTEATQVSKQGQGYAFTPGIYTEEQIAAWRTVTDAVHEAGGRIVLQLWHVGRVGHQDLQPDGSLPVAPSAVRLDGDAFTEAGFKPHPTPRALEPVEIPGIVEQFRQGAIKAKAAGFDAVEVHAANGYLLDQFLQDNTNRRTDAYGGSIENRVRLPLEVLDAVVEVWGPERVGIRLSPFGTFNGMGDSDRVALFGHLIDRLNDYGLAYLHVVERFPGIPVGEEEEAELLALRRRWHGVYLANGDYDRARAIEAVERGHANMVAFGRPFIANPDLVRRLALDGPLNEPDPATFYGGDHRGYTDYPALAEAA